MATPDTWGTRPLGDVGEWLSGGTPSKGDASFWTGDIPWVSPKDMKRPRIGEAEDHVSESAIGNGTRLVPPETLLMVVRGMILAHSFPVAITTRPVAFNQDMKALRPTLDFEPEFLLQWLQTAEQDVLRLVDVANHGTKRLPTERLFAVPVPLPPLSEQRKIAAILSSVDDTIENTEAVIAQLQVVKKAMTQELLTRGMPGRHTRFKQTEIGEIPEAWALPRLDEIADGPTNGRSPIAKTKPPGVPTFSIAAVRQGRVNIRDNLKYADVSPGEVENFLVQRGDVLIVRGNGNAGLVGKCGVVEDAPSGCIYPDILMRVRPHDSFQIQFFVEAWNSDVVHTQVLDRAKTTNGTFKINGADVRSIKVPMPPLEEQRLIGDTLSSLDDALRRHAEELAALRAMKSSVAGVLLSGALRVSPSERTP